MEKVLAAETPRAGRRPLEIRHLGRMGYRQATFLQAELVHQRREDLIPDQLILLQHPHVITLGSSARDEHVLRPTDALGALGIEVHATGRGGDVTYHGPGQIVGYAILDLKPDRCDLHRYLRSLEEVLIRALADFDLRAERKDGLTGAWVGENKLGAIGVRVSSGWITSHGFALNVDPDLKKFETIVPCGIRDHGVGSIARELGRPMDVGPVETSIVTHFQAVFG